MSTYKGLFTFDTDNHRYVSVEQADGIISDMNYHPEPEEEPKEWWYIDIHGPHKVTNNDEYYQQVRAASKEIGNYFETKEEAEKAVEKLKAFKRLKDKGFRFEGFDVVNRELDNIICGQVYFKAGNYDREEIKSDLDLLFSWEAKNEQNNGR